METVLTFGLISVILGTASGAQNIGIFGAIGVGAYIALARLWGSPISGSSMNPARTFGPNLVATDFTSYWVYVAGPLVGAVLAVAPRCRRRPRRLRCGAGRPFHRGQAPGQGVRAQGQSQTLSVSDHPRRKRAFQRSLAGGDLRQRLLLALP